LGLKKLRFLVKLFLIKLYYIIGKQQQTHQHQQFYQPHHQASDPYKPELFDDMSSYNQMPQHQQQQPTAHNIPSQPPNQQAPQMMFPGQDLLKDPVANMAMQYGQSFMPVGKEFVEKKVCIEVIFLLLKHTKL